MSGEFLNCSGLYIFKNNTIALIRFFNEIEPFSCRNFVMFLLLQKYYTNEISLEDYLKVYDFMTTASIDNLMISKLSKDELQLAEEQIKALVKLPNEVLSQKIAKEIKPENYKNLSIVDSYVLHFISKINFQRSIQSLNQEIAEDINEDEKMLWYSLKRSASSYITK